MATNPIDFKSIAEEIQTYLYMNAIHESTIKCDYDEKNDEIVITAKEISSVRLAEIELPLMRSGHPYKFILGPSQYSDSDKIEMRIF